MPYDTATDVLLLHVLRCIGFASPARIAEASGITETDVTDELIDLAVDGLVQKVPGEFGGWGLTDAGRASGAERIAHELAETGSRAVVEDAYGRFVDLNPKLLEICTDWQMRPVGGTHIPNDHEDPAYDGRVLERLTSVHARVTVICTDLAAVLTRFARYDPRLAAALDRANAGVTDAVADTSSSYHSVWFQLHEDLLVTLGLPRY